MLNILHSEYLLSKPIDRAGMAMNSLLCLIRLSDILQETITRRFMLYLGHQLDKRTLS